MAIDTRDKLGFPRSVNPSGNNGLVNDQSQANKADDVIRLLASEIATALDVAVSNDEDLQTQIGLKADKTELTDITDRITSSEAINTTNETNLNANVTATAALATIVTRLEGNEVGTGASLFKIIKELQRLTDLDVTGVSDFQRDSLALFRNSSSTPQYIFSGRRYTSSRDTISRSSYVIISPGPVNNTIRVTNARTDTDPSSFIFVSTINQILDDSRGPVSNKQFVLRRRTSYVEFTYNGANSWTSRVVQ